MTQLSRLAKEKIDRFFIKSEGTAVPSFVSYFLDSGIEGNLSQEDSLKYTAATMFAGGADTVSNLLIKTDSSAHLLSNSLHLRSKRSYARWYFILMYSIVPKMK